MSTKTQSTAQIAAILAGDSQVEKEVEKEIRYNQVVTRLLSLRVAKGLTQEYIASAMGCDPSKVSRLESGNDLGLRWTDILGYVRGLNMSISVIFEDTEIPAAESIKRCVFRIRKDLDKLTELAKGAGGNDDLAKQIHQFSGEVLFNFLVQYMDHHETLSSVIKVPNKPAPGLPCNTGEAAAPGALPLEPAGK